MKSHEMAEPVEASSFYGGAPLFSLGFGVQFNVGDFHRPVYAVVLCYNKSLKPPFFIYVAYHIISF